MYVSRRRNLLLTAMSVRIIRFLDDRVIVTAIRIVRLFSMVPIIIFKVAIVERMCT